MTVSELRSMTPEQRIDWMLWRMVLRGMRSMPVGHPAESLPNPKTMPVRYTWHDQELKR